MGARGRAVRVVGLTSPYGSMAWCPNGGPLATRLHFHFHSSRMAPERDGHGQEKTDAQASTLVALQSTGSEDALGPWLKDNTGWWQDAKTRELVLDLP